MDQAAILAHRRMIEDNRKYTGAVKVELGKLPGWASKAIRAAARKDGSRFRRGYGNLEAERILTSFGDNYRVFDHWGTSIIDGKRVLVGEPYPGTSVVANATKFADWIGCRLVSDKPTWWYPGNTLRFEFHEE